MDFIPQEFNRAPITPLIDISEYPYASFLKLELHDNFDLFLKNEAANPTGSIGDRIVPAVLKILEKNNVIAENKTLILALPAIIAISVASFLASNTDIKIISVVTDKESVSKRNILKALGCEVVVCPYELASDNYKSQNAVAERLAQRRSNTFLIDNSYYSEFNEAYSQTLATELFDQMHDDIDHIILPISSGAAIGGVAQFVKENNIDTKVWGVDAYGSVIKKYYDTGIVDANEVYPNVLEGVGAVNVHPHTKFDYIDGIVKVSDKQAVLECVQLAATEGLILGFSTGAVLAALQPLYTHFKPTDKVVVIGVDTGLHYQDKIFDEEWRRGLGFVNKPVSVASDLVKDPTGKVITLKTSELVTHAVARMRKHKISQIPVVDTHGFVGSVDEMSLFKAYLDDHRKEDTPVAEIMNPPFPIVNSFATVDEIASLIRKGHNAVIVALDNEKHGIITKSDVISHLQ